MKTGFTPEQRADPELAACEQALRSCVHCGFCLSTCPTYVEVRDELDSPRGRILLMQEMLESGGPPSERAVRHVDRCLSCLACQTTCPSDVHYMHLVDHARAHIERHHRRPWDQRLVRWLLGTVIPRPGLFRLAATVARWTGWMPVPAVLRPLRSLAPALPARVPLPATVGDGPRRVALLQGCVQRVLQPEVNAATARLLARHGFTVEIVQDVDCCGAVTHHLGQADATVRRVRANTAALGAALDRGAEAIVSNVAGCGTMLKDYGHVLHGDAGAARVAAAARDVTEVVEELQVVDHPALRVAYQSACSLQHGQGIEGAPLLRQAGFEVVEPAESHLCCGSAGTYNLLQPEMAARLRARKVAALEACGADVVASGNVGCITWLRDAGLPVVHTASLLDWATGGPAPHSR